MTTTQKHPSSTHPSQPVTPAPASGDPLDHFRQWYLPQSQRQCRYPAAVAVATSADGFPSLRMVLLKGLEPEGFVFYSTAHSHKGRDIAANPRASMVFHWPEQQQRIQVEGIISAVPDNVADAYFNSRPYFSRLGAWASLQSHPKRLAHGLWFRLAWQCVWRGWRLRRPPFWQGYLLQPLRLRLDEAGYQWHYLRASVTDTQWQQSHFMAEEPS